MPRTLVNFLVDALHEIGELDPSAGFDGTVNKNGKQGLGTQFYADGSVYKGNFKSDLRSGQGTQIYRDGSIYRGNWLEDEFHGSGSFYGSLGEVIEA